MGSMSDFLRQRNRTNSAVAGSDVPVYGNSMSSYLKQRDVETRFNAFTNDMSAFSDRISGDYAARQGKYQSRDAFGKYKDDTFASITGFTQRSAQSRKDITENRDVYVRAYGEEAVNRALSWLDEADKYLGSVRTSLDSEAEYWGNFADEATYNRYMEVEQLAGTGAEALKSELDAVNTKLARATTQAHFDGDAYRRNPGQRGQMAQTFQRATEEKKSLTERKQLLEAALERAQIRETDSRYEGQSLDAIRAALSAAQQDRARAQERAQYLGSGAASRQGERVTQADIDTAWAEHERLAKQENELKQVVERRFPAYYADLQQEADFIPLSKVDHSVTDETYRAINGLNDNDRKRTVGDIILDSRGLGDQPKEEKRARFLENITATEVGTYNYIYKKFGAQEAQDYLDRLEETVNERVGKKTAKAIQGIDSDVLRWGATMGHAVGAGLDSFVQGAKQNFHLDPLPTSATQYASQELMQDLGGFNRFLYSGLNTVGNMLPSILLSKLTGGLGGATLGKVTGAATMGLSASGNAYKQAMIEGYDGRQAQTYSMLVGASEATLQYLIGGIGALGGVTDDVLLAKAAELDKWFKRMAATWAIKIGSEITEEELQLFLEPAIKSIVMDIPYDAPNFGEMMETALVTALSTLMMEGKAIIKSGLTKPQNGNGTVDKPAAPGRIDAESLEGGAQIETAASGVETADDVLRQAAEEAARQENVPQAVADGQPASVSEVQTGTDITNPSVAQRGVESVSAVSDQQAAKNMAQVRERATILGEHGSKALSAAYNKTTARLVSAQDAQAGFFAAYTAARDGKILSAEEQRSVEKLTPGLRFAAETAGKADALRAEQAVYFGEDAELVKDDMLKRANLRSKDRRMLDAIAKNAGIKVRMVDKLVDERGYAADAQYEDGELLISLKAADPVRVAFIHDLVHRIRVVSPEAYTTLASFVRDNMSRDNWNALVKGEAFRYGERGLDYLSEEMVARAFGTLIGDSVLLDQFVKDNRNAGQIILDAIRDLIAAIKRALNGQNVKLTAEQKADFAELQANLEGMSKALEKALKQMEADVKRNTKGGNKNTASEGGEVKYALRAFLDGVRFVDVQTDQAQFDGLSDKEKTKKAIQIIKQRFAGKIVGIDNPVFVNGRTAAEYGYPVKNIDSDIRDAKMKASTELDNLMDAGTNFRTEPDGRDGHVHPDAVDDFQYYDVIFKVGNEYYKGVINIEIVAKGRLLKDITKIENITQDISSSYGKNPKSTFLRDTSMNSIRKDSEKSNPKNSESKNSLTLASNPSTTELIQENNRLKEQVEKWKGQTKRTTTPTLRQGDVDKLSRQIVKDYDGTLDWHDIAGDVKALGELILRGGEELTWSEVKERAMDIGRKIVNSAQVLVDGELESDLRELKGYLRSMKLAYTDTGEIPDFNQWRKRQFGKLTVGKDGLPVDVAYQELQGMFGEGFFPADITHPGEQLLHIAQLVDDMQGVMENPFSADMEQAIQHAANALIDGLLSEQVRQTAPTFADRQAAKVDAVRAKSRESTKRQLDRVRADRDAKLEQLKEKHRAKDKEGRERQSAGELRRKIGKHVSKLSQRLLKPSNEQHVPEGLRGAVAAMLEAINLEGPYTIDPDTGKRVKNGEGEPTKRTAAFEKLREEYRKALLEITLTEDPDLLGEDGNLAKVIGMRDIRLGDMNTEQLETVWKTIRAVEKSITDANKLLTGEKTMALDELAQEIKTSAATRKTKGNYGGLVGWADRMTNTEMLDPLTFLHSFGKGGDALYRILRSARDQRTAILKHVTELTMAATDGLTVKKLQRQKHTFTTESGDTITVTTAQLMSLYELNKRQQAQNHIYKGGIRPEVQKNGVSKDKTAKENLNAVLGKLDAPVESVRVTQEDVRKMLSTLTEEQIKAADALQVIMETYLADAGNKASMAVYGYKKFMEKNYFPISSDPHQVQSKIGDVIEGQKRPRSVAEWGSAKGTVEHANNGLVLGDIFDVFAQHAVDMATYASHLAAMEDVNRVRNFQFRDKDGNRTGAMSDIIDRVMGRNGNAYLDKLLQDVSAGTAKGGGVSFAKLTANYKAASVGLNMRVALQQPTSYLRAAAVIDPKYLVQAIGKTGGWEKALKYAPIAQWKEWGNFEINQGRQLQDIMFGTDSKLDKAKENSMWLAGKMDSITWGAIWNACELELAQTRPELRKGSEEFYQTVAERFTDVIDQTQVVDNVLGRSQIMRNTDTMQKMATSYLGEATKQYNMLYRAFMDWNREQDNAKRSKALKALGVTVTSYVAANFMNAVAQSLWDAVRDDDEREEKYWERFMYHVLPNFFDNINPLGGIPYVKDVVSTLRGYEVKRMDMQAITGLISALQGVEKALRGEGRYTVVGSMANLLAEFGRIVGLPVATVKRDLMAIARNFAVEIGDWQLQYYIERAFNSLGSTYNRAEFYNILFGAAKAGDLDAARKIRKDMEANGVKPTSIDSAMRSRYKTERAADRNFAMGARMCALLGIGE